MVRSGTTAVAARRLKCSASTLLVIGSDAPFAEGDLARLVREIHAFPFLPDRDRDRILGDNAVRFLGLDE